MSCTEEVEVRLRADSVGIISRYLSGHSCSVLLLMLHLVQFQDDYVSPDDITLIAGVLGVTRTEVSAVATFYTQYKRHPTGGHPIGVCTNSLCAIMGGDAVWEAVSACVDVGSDKTNELGRITLERIECNAACDYTPVVMMDWELPDNRTPRSATVPVDDLETGRPARPMRGVQEVSASKESEYILAGFLNRHEDEGPSADESSLFDLCIATEKDWSKPLAFGDTKGGEQE